MLSGINRGGFLFGIYEIVLALYHSLTPSLGGLSPEISDFTISADTEGVATHSERWCETVE